VKAKGMWQFMAATAREFGLTVRGGRDDRTDPAKATDAALTYLQALKDRFGSWYLAAAAYNSGGGTVSKALRKTTGKTKGTDEDFFLIMPNLPKETQDYVPKLIATARVGNDPTKYGLKVQEQGGTVDLSAVTAAPPKPARVDKVKTTTAVKALKKKAPAKKPVRKPASTRTRTRTP
jgi:membrane-bound lytic murein transglycosylase MltF